MNDQVTEQEQIQAIKDWWKENGTQVLVVGCLVAVAYFGYNWWQARQVTQLNAVTDIYEDHLEALGSAASLLEPGDEQVRTINFLADQLADEHGDSHYAFLAALNTAAFDVRRGDWEDAEDRLIWAREQATADADLYLVNYRLALLKFELGDSNAALSLLGESNEFFESIYAEARGDIYIGEGQSEEALSEYQVALANAAEDELTRKSVLQAKIESLTSGVWAISTEAEQ